jgi:hypothetical protein
LGSPERETFLKEYSCSFSVQYGIVQKACRRPYGSCATRSRCAAGSR